MKFKIGDKVRHLVDIERGQDDIGFIKGINKDFCIIRWNSVPNADSFCTLSKLILVEPKDNHPHTNIFK